MQATTVAYPEAVRSTFAALKRITCHDDLRQRRLALPQGAGHLVPVCELHAADREIVATLARWREQNSRWYPTQFRVTLAGTAAWLRAQVLDVEDRILFLVAGQSGGPVGHLGLANALNDGRAVKVDNVMRGVADCQPGLLGVALRALLDWAGQALVPRRIYLPVFSDNLHAIHFYRRLGFREDGLIPLRRHQEGDRVCYRPVGPEDRDAPDRHHLRMTYAPSADTLPGCQP
jgi:RimJ/RimL family protein N-acetyltransferase